MSVFPDWHFVCPKPVRHPEGRACHCEDPDVLLEPVIAIGRRVAGVCHCEEPDVFPEPVIARSPKGDVAISYNENK